MLCATGRAYDIGNDWYDIGKLMFDLKLNSNLISPTLTSPQLAWVPQALLLRRET